MTRCFAFAVLVVAMWVKKHARGVSKKSLQLYMVVFVSRLVSVLQHEGYLPYDPSGWVFSCLGFCCLGVFVPFFF